MRGGASTEFASEEEKKRLSGVAGRLEGMYQQFQNGQYGAEQLESANKEVAAGRGLISHLLDRSGQAMATTLREDPLIANYKGTANGKYRSYMQGIGRGDAPPLFPDETNNVPALGSNVVKGGGTYAPPAQQQEQRPNRISVSGPLGAFRAPADGEDINSEAPLTEDPAAEELPPLQAMARDAKAKNAKRANILKPPKVSAQAAIEELRKRGLIP
jgi:hypothetical protein